MFYVSMSAVVGAQFIARWDINNRAINCAPAYDCIHNVLLLY